MLKHSLVHLRSIRPVLVVVFVLACSAISQAGDEEAEFAKQADKTRHAVASAHVSLSKSARKLGMNVAARAELDAALELVPEFEDAMSELGYRRKKVDGEAQWVLDERKALPARDADSVTAAQRKRHTEARDKMRKEAAIEFIKLAKTAQRLALAPHSRASFEVALRYDALNDEARNGAGWQKDEQGVWTSPNETAERAATAKALETPEAVAINALPDWCERVFKQGAWGVKAGGVSVIGTGAGHNDLAKHACAVLAIAAGLLGGDPGELRVVVCTAKADFIKYCEVRHPGTPGLIDGWLVVENTEVGVLLTDATEESAERVVYAAALSQVRRRCGVARHPWFELGMAGNLTRRLTGRVGCVEVSGETTGPKEPGRWKRELRMLLDSGEEPDLANVIADRDPAEPRVIVAYFLVQYLCRERAAGLPEFCAAMRADGDSEGALKQAWQSDAATMQKAFLGWFNAG